MVPVQTWVGDRPEPRGLIFWPLLMAHFSKQNAVFLLEPRRPTPGIPEKGNASTCPTASRKRALGQPGSQRGAAGAPSQTLFQRPAGSCARAWASGFRGGSAGAGTRAWHRPTPAPPRRWLPSANSAPKAAGHSGITAAPVCKAWATPADSQRSPGLVTDRNSTGIPGGIPTYMVYRWEEEKDEIVDVQGRSNDDWGE